MHSVAEGNNHLLIVDSDASLRNSLAQAFSKSGFSVTLTENMEQARHLLQSAVPQFAVIDLNLKDGFGLELLKEVKSLNSKARVIVLTAYGNIAMAVAAIKEGAVDFLPKPADAPTILNALLNRESSFPPLPSQPMSADRVRWEHIQLIFNQCCRNVSETARRLNMHRRTLQRILSKNAPY